MVHEIVADLGQEPMPLDSYFKTFNTIPCSNMSHSNSSFTCKTPLLLSFHSVLFCPSLLSTSAFSSCFLVSSPRYMFSGFWKLGSLKHVPSTGWDTFIFLSLLPFSSSPGQLQSLSSRKSSLSNLFCLWILLGSSSFWPRFWFALAAWLLNKHFEVSYGCLCSISLLRSRAS